MTIIAVACENETLNLNCESFNTIKIIKADYGRLLLDRCKPLSETKTWDLDCLDRTSFTIVAERYVVDLTNNHFCMLVCYQSVCK